MMGPDANVNIRVDVDDANAQARIAALEQRLNALERSARSSARGGMRDYGRSLDDMSNKSRRADKDHKSLLSTGMAFGKMIAGLTKYVKLHALAYGGLIAVVGALKLALVAGQVTMKAWQATLRATGAAAGFAVAAIGTVLAAIRELSAAQMAPILGGMQSSRSTINTFYADRRFAMFDEKTMNSIIQSAAMQGKQIDAAFRNQLARFADYSLGDPKRLAEIQKIFQAMEKEGKVTSATYGQLQTQAPMLAKAFDEMAGSQKKGEAAAKSGTVTYKKFFDAVMDGKLKALEPFNGALDTINSTLIGKLKQAFRGVKEQLTRLGEPFLDTFKRPIEILEREISLFVLKINGTLRRVFPKLFKVTNENNNMLTRSFDRLANSINQNMGKLVGFTDRVQGWGNSIGNFFGKMGDYLRRTTTGWDRLLNKILKPVGTEVLKTFNHLLETFNKHLTDQPLDHWSQAIEGVGNLIRRLIDGFAQLKVVMAPITTAIMGMIGAIGRLASAPGMGILMALLLTGKMMGRGRAGGAGGGMGMGGAGLGLAAMGMLAPGAGGLGMLALPLMMGLSGFGVGTKGGAASGTAYAANRQLGYGVMSSALLSKTGNYAQNRSAGLSRAESLLLSQRSARAQFVSGRNDHLAASAQARIQAVREGDHNALSALKRNPALMAAYGVDNRGGYLHDTATGRRLTDAETQRMAREQNPLRGPTARDAWMQQAKKDAKEAGKVQGKEFIKNSAKQFGKSAGMMAATVGATMLGGYITQKAGTNNAMAAAGGALSGAGMGASMGAAFGPYGMLAGALIGGGLGAFSGWRNADKLREKQKNTSIQNVRNAITGGRSFNRQSDFQAALEAAGATKQDIDKLTVGSATNLEARKKQLEAMKKAGQGSLMGDFLAFASKQTGQKVTFTGNTGRGVTAFKFDGEDGVSSEDNKIENIARDFARARGYSEEAIKSAFEGKGKGKGTVGGLQYLAGLKYQGDIEMLNEDLKKLKETYPDVGAATETYKSELENISKKQTAFNENSALTASVLEGTGVEMEQVAALFDETGRSLSETTVGLNDFNKLIGMVGDTSTRAANGAGRLGRMLLASVETDINLAESRSRLEEQIRTMLTSGSVNASQGTILAGQTLNEIVGNATAELAAGNVSYSQLVGTGGTDQGMLIGQMNALLSTAKSRGADQDIINQLEKSITDMTTKIEQARTDPFARMQFDGKFSTDFEAEMNSIVADVGTQLASGGVSIEEALNMGTEDLVAFMKKNGFEVTPETETKLKNLLGGTIQNSATAMQQAMITGGAYAADAIRAALTGGTPPTKPGGGSGTASSAGASAAAFRKAEEADKAAAGGDTTSSRFSRTLASHSMFNSRIPGRRSITSGVRGTNLGSLGSDHKYGRAYDLVGDNLVSYANMVNGSGGFAEFHGGAGDGSRHLHVVPPSGDSSSPAMVGSGAGTTNYYNIEVVGSPGMDVNLLADTVMERIKRADRTNRERR